MQISDETIDIVYDKARELERWRYDKYTIGAILNSALQSGKVVLRSDVDELVKADKQLNQALDNYWNDKDYGFGFTGMGENHLHEICNAQSACEAALSKFKQKAGE